MIPMTDDIQGGCDEQAHCRQDPGPSSGARGRPWQRRATSQRSATADIAGALNAILADVFALYLKTKNFHWHMSGPHFRDYHLLLDEQADQLYAMTDPIAERIRKLGGTTLRSIGHIARTQRVLDNDADYVEPLDMLAELREDNKTLAARLREAHDVCDEHRDIASASLIEVWIDETERRTWFLFEASRPGRFERPLMAVGSVAVQPVPTPRLRGGVDGDAGRKRRRLDAEAPPPAG